MTLSGKGWYGGSVLDIAVDASTYPVGSPYLMAQYAWNFKRVWQFTLTGTADAFVRLPPATDIPTGAEIYFMRQYTNSGYDVVIQDNDGNRVGAVGNVGRRCSLHLVDNSTAAGKWIILAHKKAGLTVVP